MPHRQLPLPRVAFGFTGGPSLLIFTTTGEIQLHNEASTNSTAGSPYITIGIFALLVIGGSLQFIGEPSTFSIIVGGVMVAAGVYGIVDAVLRLRRTRDVG